MLSATGDLVTTLTNLRQASPLRASARPEHVSTVFLSHSIKPHLYQHSLHRLLDTMEVQRQSVPTRIAESARKLGSSTFSGISGLDSGFKDLRASKQLTATGKSYSSDVDHSISAARLVERKQVPAECSFRTQPSKEGLKLVQSDFDIFQNEPPASIQSWATPDIAKPSNGLIDPSLFSEGPCAFSEGWTSPRLRPAVVPLESEADEVATLGDWNAPLQSIDPAELQEAAIRSTAVRRLDQIDGHLLRVVRKQDGQQSDLEAVQELAIRLECIQSPLRHGIQPVTAKESRHQMDDANMRESTYHCPRPACQQRAAELQRLRQVSCIPRPKSCVHAGCKFRTLASEEWSTHVQRPHHNT